MSGREQVLVDALRQIMSVKRGTPATDNTIMRRLAREALAAWERQPKAKDE